jgi:hypothetical protein
MLTTSIINTIWHLTKYLLKHLTSPVQYCSAEYKIKFIVIVKELKIHA